MKSKFLLSLLLLVLTFAHGGLYAIDKDNGSFFLGFNEDTYAWWWRKDGNNDYAQQVIRRFKKAKDYALVGAPMLYYGVVALESATGSFNPLALIYADDAKDFKECNSLLQGSLTKFVNSAYTVDKISLEATQNAYKTICEKRFPYQETTGDLFNFRVWSALGMMAHGTVLTASCLAHFACGLYGGGYIIAQCIHEKFEWP